MISIKKHSQRGDTIIEVMFAMAIIGIVLAASYAAASKNLQTSQLAKERTVASTVAESQLEQLKALHDELLNENTYSLFCIDLSLAEPIIEADNPTEPDNCIENSLYKKMISRGTGDSSDQYTILVEWTPPGGSDANKSEVKLYYKHYDFSLEAASNMSLVELSSFPDGTGYVLGAHISNASGVSVFGVVYGPSQQPSIENLDPFINAPVGSSPSDFQVTIPGLTPGQTYYARAFIQDPSTGEYRYGLQITLTQNPAPATVPVAISANTTTAIGKRAATFNGTVSYSTGQVSSVGFVYTTDPGSPDEADFEIASALPAPGTNSFTASVTNLAPQAPYRVRAFYTDTSGNYYYSTVANQQSFTTTSFVDQGSTELVFVGIFNGSAYYESVLRWSSQGVDRIRNYTDNLGTQVVIGNQAENDYVASAFPMNAWIGLRYFSSTPNYRWDNSSGFSYNLWRTGQPNRTGAQTQVIKRTDGTWMHPLTGNIFKMIAEVRL